MNKTTNILLALLVITQIPNAVSIAADRWHVMRCRQWWRSIYVNRDLETMDTRSSQWREYLRRRDICDIPEPGDSLTLHWNLPTRVKQER